SSNYQVDLRWFWNLVPRSFSACTRFVLCTCLGVHFIRSSSVPDERYVLVIGLIERIGVEPGATLGFGLSFLGRNRNTAHGLSLAIDSLLLALIGRLKAFASWRKSPAGLLVTIRSLIAVPRL